MVIEPVATSDAAWSPASLKLLQCCAILFAAAVATLSAAAAEAEPACFRAAQAHACFQTQANSMSCEQLLSTDPYNLQVRFTRCEEHLRDNELLKVWLLLEQGLELCGTNSSACSRLRIARSNLEELSEKQSKDSSEAVRRQQQAEQESKRRMCLNKRQLSSDLFIKACEEAIIEFREELDLYASLAEKLLRRGQPARAVATLRRAQSLSNAGQFDAEIEAALNARVQLSAQCLQGGDLADCNRALLAGEADEFDLQLQRSKLLEASNNRDAAVEALIIAQSLKPGETGVSKQILGMLPAGSLDDRPQMYVARARARYILDDNTGAILDLRRRLETHADDDQARELLRLVREARRATVQKQCLDKNSISDCQKLLIAGEPDEGVINGRVLAIRSVQQEELAKQQRAAEAAALAALEKTAAEKAAAARMDAATADTGSPPTSGDALSASVVDGTARPETTPVPVTVTYTNKATTRGRTY